MSGEEAVQDDVELDDLFAMDEPTADLNGVAGDEAPAGDTSAAAPEPVDRKSTRLNSSHH